jgi:hemoglobin
VRRGSEVAPVPFGPVTLYERAGGQAWFDSLVERFYEAVEADPVLRPVYPDDLGPGKRHLALFLGQYWGGPPAYDQLRGHPQLRARHLPFAIGRTERDAWVAHMTEAVRAGGLSAEDEETFLTYVADTATFLINQDPLSLRPS